MNRFRIYGAIVNLYAGSNMCYLSCAVVPFRSPLINQNGYKKLASCFGKMEVIVKLSREMVKVMERKL